MKHSKHFRHLLPFICVLCLMHNEVFSQSVPVLEDSSLVAKITRIDSLLTPMRIGKDYATAMRLINSSLSDFELVKDQLDDQVFISYSANAAFFSRKVKNFPQAIWYIKMAFNRLQKHQDDQLNKKFIGLVTSESAIYYRKFENPDSAYYFAIIGYEFYQKSQLKDKYYGQLNSTLGNIHSDSGESEKAIPYILSALSWFQNTDDKYSVLILKENLGNEYIKTNNYLEAKVIFEELLIAYQAWPEATIEDISYVYYQLIIANTSLNRGRDAQIYLDSLKAIVFPVDTMKTIDNYLKVGYYRYSGINNTKLYENEKAISDFEKALELAKADNFKDPVYYNIFHEYSFLLYQLKQWEKCISLTDFAIEKLSENGSTIRSYSFLSSAYAFRALALASLYQTNPKEAFFVEAMENCNKVKELLLEKASTNRIKTAIESPSSYYNESVSKMLVDTYFELYQSSGRKNCAEEILNTVEVIKNLEIKNNLRKADIAKATGVPESILNAEEAIMQQINSLKNQNLGLPEKSDTLARNLDKIVTLSQNLQNLYDDIIKNYPAYFHLMYRPSIDSIADIQTKIGSNQTIIEYVEGQNHLFACIIRNDFFDCIKLCNINSVVTLIDTFQYGIGAYYTAQQPTDSLQITTLQAYVYGATQLYQLLVRPLEDRISSNVQIIPSSILGDLTFAALLTEQPRRISFINTYKYWVKEKNISYSYSINLTNEMENNARNIGEKSCLFSGFAPFANAISSDLALPYSLNEIKKAGNHLGANQVYLDQQATLSNFMQSINQCKIIHIASHTSVSKAMDESSWLLFAEGEKLYIRDIYGLKMKTGLVFLSACDSGLGRVKGSEGLMSLSRAFAYAGASCIVTTLWKINDKHTEELNAYFYEAMAKGSTVSESSHYAQLKFLANNTTTNAHPYFWAGVIPIGFTNYRVK